MPTCERGLIPRSPQNRSVAGSGRSKHWKRSTSPPSRNARKPFLPQASLRAKRLVPRSHRNDSGRVESVPFCVNRWDRPRAAQPLAHSAKAHPCPSLPASGAPDPAEPTQNRSGAGSGRSEHWKRSPQPLAHSAKAHPCPSLPASGAPDPAEPNYTSSSACRASPKVPGRTSILSIIDKNKRHIWRLGFSL